MKMTSFRKHLEEKLKNPEFQILYEQELELAKISVKIHEEREKKGLSQAQLAKLANITQQQISKIENGINCNIATLLKACRALNLKLEIV